MAGFNEIDGARKLLGLAETATPKEIRSAYRKLSYRHHPDQNTAGGPVENEEAMKQLNRAYRLLMDYCGNYRCSFREEDVTRTYPDEEYWKKFRERWFDSI